MHKSLVRTVWLILALALFTVACGSDSNDDPGGVVLSDVWSREPAPGQPNAAIYGTVINNTDETVTITSVSTPLAERAELHESLMNDGVMSMQQRTEGFQVDPGTTFVFEPGGPHMMVFDIEADVYAASTVEATLTLGDGSTVSATGELRSIAGDDMEMDDMEMDDMGNSEDS